MPIVYLVYLDDYDTCHIDDIFTDEQMAIDHAKSRGGKFKVKRRYLNGSVAPTPQHKLFDAVKHKDALVVYDCNDSDLRYEFEVMAATPFRRMSEWYAEERLWATSKEEAEAIFCQHLEEERHANPT